jgi:hypothetical protein
LHPARWYLNLSASARLTQEACQVEFDQAPGRWCSCTPSGRRASESAVKKGDDNAGKGAVKEDDGNAGKPDKKKKSRQNEDQEGEGDGNKEKSADAGLGGRQKRIGGDSFSRMRGVNAPPRSW